MSIKYRYLFFARLFNGNSVLWLDFIIFTTCYDERNAVKGKKLCFIGKI